MSSTGSRPWRWGAIGLVAVAVATGVAALPNFKDVSGCIRAHVWPDPLIALHVTADGFIALAYLMIPGSLLILRHRRDDIPVDWIAICFAAFILLCGMTHVMDAITIWRPVYWISGKIKAATALVSLTTAALLQFRVLPVLLQIPTRGRMNEALTRAADANFKLEAQAAELFAAKETAEREAAAAREARAITEEANAKLEAQTDVLTAAQKKAEEEAAMARETAAALRKASEERDERDAELRMALERERALALTIRESSTPVLLVVQKPATLLVPVIGVLDRERAQQLMDTVTRDVVAHRASTVIIDLKGVGVVDAGVANTILDVVKVIRLLGAQCVLTSIGPAMASTIVRLGLDLGPGLPTLSSLASGIEVAMRRRAA